MMRLLWVALMAATAALAFAPYRRVVAAASRGWADAIDPDRLLELHGGSEYGVRGVVVPPAPSEDVRPLDVATAFSSVLIVSCGETIPVDRRPTLERLVLDAEDMDHGLPLYCWPAKLEPKPKAKSASKPQRESEQAGIMGSDAARNSGFWANPVCAGTTCTIASEARR